MTNTNSRGLAINGGRRVFAFHGRAEAWRPVKGATAPDGDGYVVHCLPGRFVATGPTLDAAVTSLMNILDATMQNAKPDMDRDAWWRKALHDMGAIDRSLFEGIVRDAAMRGSFELSKDGKDLYMFRPDDDQAERCDAGEAIGAR